MLLQLCGLSSVRLIIWHLHPVQVLIGDEPEQGMENLMEVEIPDDVEKKLTEADIREQQELAREEEQMREEEEKKRRGDAEATGKEQEAGLTR